MEEFFINDYLIIEDTDKIKMIQNMGFDSNYPYRVVSIGESGAPTILNNKNKWIFSPVEMEYVKKATISQVEKVHMLYEIGDKIVINNPIKLISGETLDITIGKEYEVVGVEITGLPVIIDDVGGRLGFFKSDLLFIEKVNPTIEEPDENLLKLLDKYKAGESIEILHKEKIRSDKKGFFLVKRPYEVVTVLEGILSIIVTNENNKDLLIRGDELRYIRTYVNTQDKIDVETMLLQLENKFVSSNLNFMMDRALEEKRFDRAKEVMEMMEQFKGWIHMKYPNDVYEAFGFGLLDVKGGYRAYSLVDNYIYEMTYKSKKDAFEWIDFIIDFMKNHS